MIRPRSLSGTTSWTGVPLVARFLRSVGKVFSDDSVAAGTEDGDLSSPILPETMFWQYGGARYSVISSIPRLMV